MKLGKLQPVVPDQVHRFFQQDFFLLPAAVLGLFPGGQHPEGVRGLFLHRQGEGLPAGLGDGPLLHHGPVQQKLDLAGQKGVVPILQMELELHLLGFQLVDGLVFLHRRSGFFHLHPKLMVSIQKGAVGKHQLGKGKGLVPRLAGSLCRYLPASIRLLPGGELEVVDHHPGELCLQVVGEGVGQLHRTSFFPQPPLRRCRIGAAPWAGRQFPAGPIPSVLPAGTDPGTNPSLPKIPPDRKGSARCR